MLAVSLAADLRLHVYPRWRSVVRLLAAATAVAVRVIVGLWIRGGGVCNCGVRVDTSMLDPHGTLFFVVDVCKQSAIISIINVIIISSIIIIIRIIRWS